MAADDGLLIRWPDPLPDGERIVLRHGSSGDERAANPAGDRRSCVLALGELGPGAWEVHLEAGSLTRPLLTDDPGFSLDELRAYAAFPRRRSVRVTRSREGRVMVRVHEVVPHAEVEVVHPRDDEIRVGGLLAYSGPRSGEARLVALAREGGGTAVGAARIHGTEFHARLPLTSLAAVRPPVHWDLWLDVADVHARLATLLDDAPGKQGKLAFPSQTVSSGGGELIVRPYYTARDELSVACHRADSWWGDDPPHPPETATGPAPSTPLALRSGNRADTRWGDDPPH
ncbi:hypothetical protein, partial [Actinomadura rubrisoli]